MLEKMTVQNHVVNKYLYNKYLSYIIVFSSLMCQGTQLSLVVCVYCGFVDPEKINILNRCLHSCEYWKSCETVEKKNLSPGSTIKMWIA